ncbi:MAG TPA: HipA domain-containing protein [Terrimesophilobacter sp.]|nr:HipA domain-containing protein [Terrimesophilobacter sp.]
MSAILEAWLEGRHVGQFVEDGAGRVLFSYDSDAPETPISLSLPRDRPAAQKAAANFLSNLLPDEDRVRARMASIYGAAGVSTFDLLEKAGGDIAGGLVLVSEGETPTFVAPELNPALDRDIAERIAAIKRDPDAWAPSDQLARFSLAGTQGKFALARIGDDWYWSNASQASSHIIKPARPELRGLERAEAAALNLAAKVGVPAPPASVLDVLDQSAFLVERFDRTISDPTIQRLHAEDFAQATGVSPKAKYDMSAVQALRLLEKVDRDQRLALGFIRQLAFNTVLGNADAHAKNYSLLLRPAGVELAPIYDAVPVGLYPRFDQDLAMGISGAHRPRAVDLSHWRKLARTAGLDPDAVTHIVITVAKRVAEHADTAWQSLDADQARALHEITLRNTEKLLAGSGGVKSTPSPTPSSTD